MDSQPMKKKMDELDWSMLCWQAVVVVLAVLLLLGYAVAFSSSANLAGEHGQEKWGQFGDFIGGIMNPLVAFAAFYWLTQSVKLQKQELKETRDELRASALAQQEQVENGRKSIRLAALTALITAKETKISLLNREIVQLTEQYFQAAKNGVMAPGVSANVWGKRSTLVKERDQLTKSCDQYVKEMEKILLEQEEGSSPE